MARPLADCASRRSFSDSECQFICTHPDVVSIGRLVTPEVCRVCPLRDSMPPDLFLGFPFAASKTVRRPTVEIVVAHYQEDLAWLTRFSSLKCVVYTKGRTTPPKAIRLPNVGREAHTYLHHIIENYDDLEDVTVFLQGNPHEHVERLFEKICSLNEGMSYLDLGDDILVEDGIGVPPQRGLPLARFFELLFERPAPAYFSCRAGACFAVARETIRRRPREFYERALRLVLTESLGPWSIERLWQRIFESAAGTSGILTASDSGFFRELQFLIRSIRQVEDRPVCVIDLGLTEEQRRWCVAHRGVIVWRKPKLFAPMRRIFRQHWWQAWIKPFYFLQSPFDRALWIDADCVVLRPLDEVFQKLEKQALFFRDGTSVVTENDPRLYQELPISPDVCTRGINVNSGVVGLDRQRDAEILDSWAWAVQWIALRPHFQKLSAWADQGLLLWALHRNGATKLIDSNLQCNRPAFEQDGLLRSAFLSGETVLSELKRRFPDDTIVHFLGLHKLSKLLDSQFEEIFCSRNDLSEMLLTNGRRMA